MDNSIENQKTLLDVAAKLAELIQQEQEKQPYSLNLVDLLHANENAHSRILGALLQYKQQGKYILLEDFLRTMLKFENVPIESPNIDVEHTTNLGRRIDILIYRRKEYAIIIENKCNGADDQDEQIDDYVKYVNELLKIEHPIVIYLTKDGNKSLPQLNDNTKKVLNIDPEEYLSNLIELNYKEHILPWIQQLCEQIDKEPLIKSALIQYADYLNRFLNINNEQNQQTMMDETKKLLKIENLSQAVKYQDNVNHLHDTLDRVIQNYVDEIAQNKILVPLENWLKIELNNELLMDKNRTSFKYNRFNLYIKKPSCKWGIGIETANGSIFYGIYLSDSQDTNTKNYIYEKFPNSKEWKESPVWPRWQWSKVDVLKFRDSYWSSVDSGDINPLDTIQRIIQEIYSKLQN